MNICYRCDEKYEPYVKKIKRYGVMTNGIIFGVGYKRKFGATEAEVFRRKDKYIPLCESCMNELINYIEIFNDNKKQMEKYAKHDEKEVQKAYERISSE